MSLVKKWVLLIKQKYPRTYLRIYKIFFFTIKKIQRAKHILLWIFSTSSLLRRRKNRPQRLLVIYDLSYQPFSIGDFLLFQQGSLIQSKLLGLDLIDVAIVYNVERSNKSVEFLTITSEATLYHLASIVPVAQLNQRLGSVFVFNSRTQFESFVTDNMPYYQVWPSAVNYAAKDYLYWIVFNDLMVGHFKSYGYVPFLKCRTFLEEWARSFYQMQIKQQVPVTVNLRNNRLFSQERNSNMDCWIEFFACCKVIYPVVFIIICGWNEVDERMIGLENVIVAKKHHTGIEQDLALINTSVAHLGTASGPFTMAICGKKPYLMFNFDGDFRMYDGMTETDGFSRFAFATTHQKLTKQKESVEILNKEFALLWTAIESDVISGVEEKTFTSKQRLTWLR
jgi:hypothetical protein